MLVRTKKINRDGIADSTSHLNGLGDHDLPHSKSHGKGGKALNQEVGSVFRPLDLPRATCIRTSSAWSTWVRSIQYNLSASFRAIATFAIGVALRNFSR